jgi:hypothetical protein
MLARTALAIRLRWPFSAAPSHLIQHHPSRRHPSTVWHKNAVEQELASQAEPFRDFSEIAIGVLRT